MKPEFQPEFEAILKKLRVNDPRLTSLELLSKEITDADIKKLATVLPSNHTLTSLNLNINQIGDAGAKALSLALKKNHTLTVLYLWGNQIRDALEKTLKAFINRNIQLAEEAYQAAAEGNVDQVRQALQQGVSLLGHAHSDSSLLHVAAEKGRSALMQFLITHCKAEGLPLNPRNYQGQTPADLARASGHMDIVALLESSSILPLPQAVVQKEASVSLQSQSLPQLQLPQQVKSPLPVQEAIMHEFSQSVVTMPEKKIDQAVQETPLTSPSIHPLVSKALPIIDHISLEVWASSQSVILDTTQQNTLVEFLNKAPDFVTRCELAQVPRREELSYALATDAEKMQQVKEQKSIAQQPLLQGYYFTFQRILNQTFIAALAISSELIKNDQAASRAGSASSALGLVMKALTVVAGAVPGLSAATSILSVLMEKGLAIHANNQLTRLVSIAPGPAQMEYLIERIARQLTLQLAEGLQQLTEKKTFPLWDALKTFYAKAKKPFVVELAETLQQRQAVEDALQLLKALMQEDKTFDREKDFLAESVRYLLAFKQNKQNTQDANQKKKAIDTDENNDSTKATAQPITVTSSATPSIKASSPAIPVPAPTSASPPSYAEKTKVEQLERQLAEERAERQRMQKQVEKLLQHFNPNQDTEISAGNQAFLQQNVQRITSTSATLFGYSLY